MIPSEILHFVMAMLAVYPVLLVFLFFQRYFTKGMTIGGVKG
jgi:ABC-type glycerol-3-phosphate transport system permease component